MRGKGSSDNGQGFGRRAGNIRSVPARAIAMGRSRTILKNFANRLSEEPGIEKEVNRNPRGCD
jgi:hypothetical protein